jgi:hypothetical protein
MAPIISEVKFTVNVTGGNITEHQFMEVLSKTGVKEHLAQTVNKTIGDSVRLNHKK